METNASSGYHASPSDSLPLTLPSPTLITDRSEAKSEAPQDQALRLRRLPLNRSEVKSEASRSARPFPRDFAPDRSEAKSEVPRPARPSPSDRSEAKSEAAGAAWLDLDVIIFISIP